MVAVALPAHIVALLDEQLEGRPRAPLANAAAKMSACYRAGAHSSTAVPDEAAALAYALVRMPATFAAVSVALAEAARRLPGFAPSACLDVGAGPGTATLAAMQIWPSLDDFQVEEPNSAMRAMAWQMLERSTDPTRQIVQLSASRSPGAPELGVLAYVLAEMSPPEAALLAVTTFGRLSKTGPAALVIVEPGTPAGYARILAARTSLINAGAAIAAPCPHARDCPLVTPDWCHFSVRLQRSRAHRALKGADAPFEDERFAYLVAVAGAAQPAIARVIAPPQTGKTGVQLVLCSTTGRTTQMIPRRDKSRFKRAARLTWGDTFD